MEEEQGFKDDLEMLLYVSLNVIMVEGLPWKWLVEMNPRMSQCYHINTTSMQCSRLPLPHNFLASSFLAALSLRCVDCGGYQCNCAVAGQLSPIQRRTSLDRY